MNMSRDTHRMYLTSEGLETLVGNVARACLRDETIAHLCHIAEDMLVTPGEVSTFLRSCVARQYGSDVIDIVCPRNIPLLYICNDRISEMINDELGGFLAAVRFFGPVSERDDDEEENDEGEWYDDSFVPQWER